MEMINTKIMPNGEIKLPPEILRVFRSKNRRKYKY
jgi:hypothetical protein